MSDYMKFRRCCPICDQPISAGQYVWYEGERYHPECSEAAKSEYAAWDESTDTREMQLVGEVIADWIAKRELHRDADAFARRNSGLIKATLFLQSVLGPASHSIPSPRRVQQ